MTFIRGFTLHRSNIEHLTSEKKTRSYHAVNTTNWDEVPQSWIFWPLRFIDDKLNWKDHVSCVCRKVAPGLGVIIKTRKVLRNESPKSLYYSFIYPFLIYCNPVWGCACKTNIEPLLIFQKGLKNYHCCSSQIAFTAIVLSTEAFELWKNI